LDVDRRSRIEKYPDRRSGKTKPPGKDDIDKWSTWFGYDGANLDPSTVIMLQEVDLAVGQLVNFNTWHILNYPSLKDPSKDYEPGTSLCRYGFAFVDLNTQYDVASHRFIINNFPVPIFPNEGILGRIAEILLVDTAGNRIATPFPFKMIETSSPGIRGQSGGPIFDRNGTIWGIQSSTRSYALDFNTKVDQFYHIGVGVHIETIVGLLASRNIKFDLATY